MAGGNETTPTIAALAAGIVTIILDLGDPLLTRWMGHAPTPMFVGAVITVTMFLLTWFLPSKMKGAPPIAPLLLIATLAGTGCMTARGARGSDERCIALEERYETVEFLGYLTAGTAGGSAIVAALPEDKIELRVGIALGSALMTVASTGFFAMRDDTGEAFENECGFELEYETPMAETSTAADPDQ